MVAADAVPDLRRTPEGLRFAAPVADMSVHLPWLLTRLRSLGGGLDVCAGSPTSTRLEADAVVNCAGPWRPRARRRREPPRGPRADPPRPAPAVREWLLDQPDPARPVYVVPREHDVVLGGTAQEGEEDPRPDPQTTGAIRARCERLVPALRGARVRGEAVGLRPGAAVVRLEARRPRRALLRPRRRGRDPRVGLRLRGSRTVGRAAGALGCSAVK